MKKIIVRRLQDSNYGSAHDDIVANNTIALIIHSIRDSATFNVIKEEFLADALLPVVLLLARRHGDTTVSFFVAKSALPQAHSQSTTKTPALLDCRLKCIQPRSR